MNEEKKKIVIASVLKPVDDTRMAEKIGQSLSDRFEVHIIGFPTSIDEDSSLKLHRLPFFSRISFQRLTIPWKILACVKRLKPNVLIVTTHELLFIGLLAKLSTSCKIIYDVQENYYRNIKFTSSFPAVIKNILAMYIRAKELLTSPFIDHFFLAEVAYQNELNFLARKFTVLPNKVKKPAQLTPRGPFNHTLLFSGTLSETTGVFMAIDIATRLHQLEPAISLVIIGRCARPAELERIKKTIAPHSFIKLIGGESLVPHAQIIDQIRMAGAGIIAYPENPATINSVPTKLYEYLGYKLPILLIRHPVWETICAEYPAAVVFDPTNFQLTDTLPALRKGHFYVADAGSLFWEDEVPNLIRTVSSLIF